MSEIVILNFKDPSLHLIDVRSQVDAIFFETSTKKEFKTIQEKEDFNWKYVGFYLAHYPEYSWVAVKDGRVLGYVVSMPFSQDPSLSKIQSHLQAFADQIVNYPAHLHVNCHESSRGLGVGKRLVLNLLEQLKNQGVKGLHIMTGPDSSNQIFYQKLGFDFQITLNSILFMGIKL